MTLEQRSEEMTEYKSLQWKKAWCAVKEQHSQRGYIRVTGVGRMVVREVRKVAWESQITEGPSGLSKDSEFILGRRGLNKGQLCKT